MDHFTLNAYLVCRPICLSLCLSECMSDILCSHLFVKLNLSITMHAGVFGYAHQYLCMSILVCGCLTIKHVCLYEICLHQCLYVYLSICNFLSMLSICVCLSMLSICICLSVCLYIFLSLVYLSLYLSQCLSVCQSICLNVVVRCSSYIGRISSMPVQPIYLGYHCFTSVTNMMILVTTYLYVAL